MANEVQAAWVAAAAAVVVSLVSLAASVWTGLQADRAQKAQDRSAQDIEKLRSRLDDQNDADKARRDYEYEARKGLYTELYPLIFQLHESAHRMQNYVLNLARATRDGSLGDGKDNWLTSGDAYYFERIVYALLSPLAIYVLMSRKLTFLDLSLDPDLRRQHFLASQAYSVLRSDFDLTQSPYPPIVFGGEAKSYAPPETPPASAPDPMSERCSWRQGLYSGQVGEAVDVLIREDADATRVLTYSEFVKMLGGADIRTDHAPHGLARSTKQALQPLIEVLRDFHPARRPVTWRILLTQAACYRAVTSPQRQDATPASMLAGVQYAVAPDKANYDWIGDGSLSIPASLRDKIDFKTEQDGAFATADLFIASAISEISARVDPRPT